MANQQLPQPTGPYTVGVWAYDVIDPNQTDTINPEGRPIPIHFYFPLAHGLHTLQKKLPELRAPHKNPALHTETYAMLAETSRMAPGIRNLVIFNHGNTIPMTEYAIIVQDLASHGLIVATLQHQLATDLTPPPFWQSRSTSRHGTIINNLMYVFECLKRNNGTLFSGQLNTNNIALIGHSMGANAALLLAQRTASPFLPHPLTLLPHDENATITKECIVALDADFDFPSCPQYPILFCLSDELHQTRAESTLTNLLQNVGYQFKHYKGSRRLSFRDHLYNGDTHSEAFFDGTELEYYKFWGDVRGDIRAFLKEHGIL